MTTIRRTSFIEEPVTAHDWPEDFSDENGNYSGVCCSCGNEFVGHKRRFSCKKCSPKRLTIGEFAWWIAVVAVALGMILFPLFANAAESPRLPRIIYFGASWCAPCREALHGKDNFPDWLTPEGWRINGSDQAHIQIVDIDERNDLMEQYRVKTVPCMVVVTDKGGSDPIPYTGRASIATAIKRAWK